LGEELVAHGTNWENRLEILKELALPLLVPRIKKGVDKYILSAIRKVMFLTALKENNG